MVAVGKGQRQALWTAAATLDRYLVRIGQKQIYGTQFSRLQQESAPWTQEPYDRDLISDALRSEFHVPSLGDQRGELNKTEAGRKATGQ